MQPVTILILLAFYALVGGYAYVASNLWLTQNPLLWLFMGSGVAALAALVYALTQRRAVGRLDFFVTSAIALLVMQIIW